MGDSKVVDREKEGMGIKRILLIVLIVFTVTPIMIMSVVYLTNDNFKFIANKYLSTISGPIGEHFKSFPTREEKEAQKREVAKYLAELDTESASDKLIIIQKEDEKLYSDLIKMITQINSQQAEKVLERIRQNSIKKDILASTIEQIQSDKVKELQDKAKYYETIKLVNAVEEIENKLMNEMVSFKDMGLILEQVKDDTAAKILKNLDQEVATRLLSIYESKEKRQKIEELLNKMKDREKELMNIAKIYEAEKPEKILEDIGSDKKYKLNELSIIYRNMNMIQAAQVFEIIEDKDFAYKLLEQIKTDEILAKGNDLLTPDILRAVEIYSEYNKEIDELVKVYGKMQPDQIGEMITKLLKNRNAPKKYTFDNDTEIIISDQDIAINILRKLKEKTVAEVLTTLDSSLASDISKRLTIPK